ncbi:hypothetical protein D3C83_221350 [compost metagenome]
MPAQFAHQRRQRVRFVERDAAAVMQLAAAKEMVESQRPHAVRRPASQRGLANARVRHRDAA